MYDTRTGVWLSEDPSGFEAADTNLRRYVGNRPTFTTDPFGLEEKGLVGDPNLRKGTPENGHNGLGEHRFRSFQEMYDYFQAVARANKWGWPLTKGMKNQLSRGCVGLAMMRFGYWEYSDGQKGPKFPTQIPGMHLFTTQKGAMDYLAKLKASGKEYRVFALQYPGNVKVTPMPHPGRELDEVFDDEVTQDAATNAKFPFNFATWHELEDSGYWEFMDEGLKFGWGPLGWPTEAAKCPIVRHRPKLPPWADTMEDEGGKVPYVTFYGVAPVNSAPSPAR